MSSIFPPLTYSQVLAGTQGSDWTIKCVDVNEGRGSAAPSEYAVLTRRKLRPNRLPKMVDRSGFSKNPDLELLGNQALTRGDSIRPISPMGGENGRAGSGRSSSLVQRSAPGPAIEGCSGGDDVAFGDLATVRAMSTGRDTIIVTYDTEFTTYTLDSGESVRVVNSYQFACIDPADRDFCWQVVMLPLANQRISIEDALYIVVQEAELWKCVPEMRSRGYFKKKFYRFNDGKLNYERSKRELFKLGALNITLVGHYLQADLTAFARPAKQRSGGEKYNDPLRQVNNASGGLVSLKPLRLVWRDGRGDWWMPLRITVRDTMGQAPPDSKRLEDLGAVCGVEKISVADDIKSDMGLMLREDMQGFLEYGIQDCVVPLEYLGMVWGDNIEPPVTLSGGGASAVRAGVGRYWGIGNAAELTARLQGLVAIDREDVVDDDPHKLQYYVQRELQPIDGHAGMLHFGAAQAFHGGLNTCPIVGYYKDLTIDVDAQNAYPTAMAMVVDPDFEAGAISRIVEDHTFTEGDFPRGFATGLVAYCEWEFPEHVQHPCLPVSYKGSVLYPRTSRGLGSSLGVGMDGTNFQAAFEGVWLMGPEILLAVKLGARVRCQVGYFTSVYKVGGEDSRALRSALRMMVEDRVRAKKKHGKKSLQELVIKVATNSVYGKLAQDVSDRSAWDSWVQEMENIGGSAITSPYHASMTTSIVRAQLLAVANQVADVYSITTDGFITGRAVAEIEALDLYGLASELRDARECLTGDPGIWEVKHSQNDLLNLTTRGNVSREDGGVLAKAGIKVPEGIERGSIEERVWFFDAAVSREGKVTFSYTDFPKFRDLSHATRRKDFIAGEVVKRVSLDYDLKRKPRFETMRAVMVNHGGRAYEVACFETEPWDSVVDYKRAKDIAKHIVKQRPGTSEADGVEGCLRTVDEWRDFQRRYEARKRAAGRRPYVFTAGADTLKKVVAGWRDGRWSVPTLDSRNVSVDEKVEWLSDLGYGPFTRSMWDHMSKKDRRKQVLDDINPGDVEEAVELMQSLDVLEVTEQRDAA